MRKYVDYKYTSWGRMYFKEDADISKIIDKLEQGYLPLELGYDGVVPNLENCEWEPINDTEEYLTLEENDGQSTIELMEWNENQTHLEPIWDNSYESQIKRKKIINENR